MRVSVIGAGIAGLACALEFAYRGVAVEVFERRTRAAPGGCSWYAGGMLAPWCERESSEALIAQLGLEGLLWWREQFEGTQLKGTLVLAHGRDRAELGQFARRTQGFTPVEGAAIGALEPDLAGRFDAGLYFPEEGHLDPRAALVALRTRLESLGVAIHYGQEAEPGRVAGALQVDCRGLAARADLSDLRGVKGEMLLLRLPGFTLTRPVRILHPRLPVYLVPRGAGVFLVGATMLESDEEGRISVRSMLELLSAAYALHPSFGEAEVLETGTGVRAAFPDNLPRLRWRGRTLFVNGLYRHGFLVAPALARRAALAVLEGRHFAEVMDADPGERRLA